MKRVGRADTAPELAVRSRLHRVGLRFRVNVRGLPGTPDIVLRRYQTVIFVHGCFWHGHDCAHGSVQARSNADYWRGKIEANRSRDARKAAALEDLGWCVETVFECESSNARKLNALEARIRGRAPG